MHDQETSSLFQCKTFYRIDLRYSEDKMTFLLRTLEKISDICFFNGMRGGKRG